MIDSRLHGGAPFAFMPDLPFRHSTRTVGGRTIRFVQHPATIAERRPLQDGRMNLLPPENVVEQDLSQ